MLNEYHQGIITKILPLNSGVYVSTANFIVSNLLMADLNKNPASWADSTSPSNTTCCKLENGSAANSGTKLQNTIMINVWYFS